MSSPEYCTCGHSLDEHQRESLRCSYHACECARFQPQLSDAFVVHFLKEAHRLARTSRYRIECLQLSPYQSSLRGYAEMLGLAETALTLAMHSIEPLVDALTETEAADA